MQWTQKEQKKEKHKLMKRFLKQEKTQSKMMFLRGVSLYAEVCIYCVTNYSGTYSYHCFMP